MKMQQLFNQREKHCFSSLAKTVLLLCYFSHYFHIYFTIISSPICYTQYILFQGAICRYINPYLYRDFILGSFFICKDFYDAIPVSLFSVSFSLFLNRNKAIIYNNAVKLPTNIKL